MTRHGTVLVFREGVTLPEIRAALDNLSGLLDPCWISEMEAFALNRPVKLVPYRVEAYNDEYGQPVWYVP